MILAWQPRKPKVVMYNLWTMFSWPKILWWRRLYFSHSIRYFRKGMKFMRSPMQRHLKAEHLAQNKLNTNWTCKLWKSSFHYVCLAVSNYLFCLNMTQTLLSFSLYFFEHLFSTEIIKLIVDNARKNRGNGSSPFACV